MTRTTRFKLMTCFVLLTGSFAAAEEETDEVVEKVAVRNRLFSVEGRWEAGVSAGFSLLPRLTDHYNFNASVAYNVKDWLGIELRGGYALSMHSDVANQLQDEWVSSSTIPATDATDLWEMTGHGVVGVRFQPIYGKLNLMSELPVHFQLYLWAGGGAGYLKRESLVICQEKSGPTTCGSFLKESRVSPLVSLALGFRFFLPFQGHSLKLEVRDWSFMDQYQTNIDRATGTGGLPSPEAGITNLVQIDVGYAFIF